MAGAKQAEKQAYFDKLHALFSEYPSLFVVNVDNVSSQQMHTVRKELRGEAVVLLGKNTMIRRAIRDYISQIPELERLLPIIKGNVGFVFTKGDLKSIRDKIVSNVVAAPAKAGAIAPVDVFVPAGNTGMEPGKTSFFQALQVPTKITRGTIEIVSDVHLVHKDGRVGASEATLLNMLNISPFTYGLKVVSIYDNGNVFGVNVLDITEEELLGHFMAASKAVASISLATNYPTVVSVPHTFINYFKKALGISLATDYTVSYAEQVCFSLLPLPKDFCHCMCPQARSPLMSDITH